MADEATKGAGGAGDTGKSASKAAQQKPVGDKLTVQEYCLAKGFALYDAKTMEIVFHNEPVHTVAEWDKLVREKGVVNAKKL